MSTELGPSVPKNAPAGPLKRAGRVLVKFGVSAAIGLAIVGALCLGPVEYEPYFKTAYYQETVSRLHAAQATSAVADGDLAVGFGRELLTPALNSPADNPDQGDFRGLPLAGYGNRKGRFATGVHDELHVKAMAFRVNEQLAVVASADALIIPREVTDLVMPQLARELQLRRDQVYLSATHTHAGLGGWGEGIVAEAFAGGFQPGVREWMASRIVGAVRQAIADLTPGQIGHGAFAAPDYIRNRLVGKLGHVDDEFSYIVAKQADGDVGVLGSYGAHATVLSSRVMELSGDYPGYWQRTVERATSGTAIFLAGAVGSHAPVANGSDFDAAERVGEALGRMLLEDMAQRTLTNKAALNVLGLTVTLPSLQARVTDGLRLRPWVAERFVPVRRTTYLQGLRLNQAVWISTPCDFSGELALPIKDAVARRGGTAVITSFNGDYVGYVVPSRYYHLNSYESRVMSFFGPYLPEYFDELIRGIATGLMVSQPAATKAAAGD